MDTNRGSAHQSQNEDNFVIFSLGLEFLNEAENEKNNGKGDSASAPSRFASLSVFRVGFDAQFHRLTLRVRSFGVIWIRISDPRSHGSWCIKGTHESTLVTDSSASLMYHDPSDLGSLIQIRITPKERTLALLSCSPNFPRAP